MSMSLLNTPIFAVFLNKRDGGHREARGEGRSDYFYSKQNQ